MSQPMLGQGQMMNPGMTQQMMSPGMQPMGQQPMMNNPGMQNMPMGNQMSPGMDQNPAMMNNSPVQSPGMQRPMGQSPVMGNQMNPGMPQSPMMGQNYGNMNTSPMQSPMMNHQPMNTGTYQMAPQANNMPMMGQGQPMTGGQNYRLSQQYNQPMGQMSGQGMTQPMMSQMGQGTMNPQMGGPMMAQGAMGSPQMMGQNTMGQGMPSTNQTGWPPGYAPPPPSNTASSYGNPSAYNQQYSSPSQSPSMPHYTPSATNPFAQQVGQNTMGGTQMMGQNTMGQGMPSTNQAPSGWPPGYNPANTGQYNPQQTQSPSPYGNTGYGQQPTQYQQPNTNTGAYGAPNQMYNYRQ
jgi:hypothetical protein